MPTGGQPTHAEYLQRKAMRDEITPQPMELPDGLDYDYTQEDDGTIELRIIENPKKIIRSTGKKKRANLATQLKIDRLREYRREFISEQSYPPKKTNVCKLPGIEIDPKTAREYAPELWANWNNLDYDMILIE